MYLLDTNVLSDAHKGVNAPTKWLKAVDPTLVYLSVVTIGEITRGIEMVRAKDDRKASRLTLWLSSLRAENGDRILPVDEAVAI